MACGRAKMEIITRNSGYHILKSRGASTDAEEGTRPDIWTRRFDPRQAFRRRSGENHTPRELSLIKREIPFRGRGLGYFFPIVPSGTR